MTDNENLDIFEPLHFFCYGAFIADALLRGHIFMDLTPDNYGYREDGTLCVSDVADTIIVGMPEELSEETFEDMCLSVKIAISGIKDDFKLRSYFRAGLTSHGGPLGIAIFSNLANSRFSSLMYAAGKNWSASFDLIELISKQEWIDAVAEWKGLPLEKITPGNYPRLYDYECSDIRKSISPADKPYLDRLYFIKCYLTFIQDKAMLELLPLLMMNMALSARQNSKHHTVYGLCKKCIVLKPHVPDIEKFCKTELNRIVSAGLLHPSAQRFIDGCVDDDFLELIWVLEDLDTLQIDIDTLQQV